MGLEFRSPRLLLALLVPLGVVATLMVTTAAAQSPGPAQPDSVAAVRLGVAEQAFGTDVDRENRVLVGEAKEFASDVGRVFCWTRITGARRSTQITHIWYHAGEPKAKVVLPVRSADWRTYSSKTMLPEWSGRWEVAVLDAQGSIIGRAVFSIR